MKHLRASFMAALAASALLAPNAWCFSDGDCKQGRVLVEGQCVDPTAKCTKDRDCDGDDVCDAGACRSPNPKSHKAADFAWDGELLGMAQLSGTSPQFGYGGMAEAGIWLGKRAALMARAELMLYNGADIRQVFAGPALRFHRVGGVSGNIAVGALFMQQPENTGTHDFSTALAVSVSSWYEIAGPFAFIYGAQLAFPMGVDPNAHNPPQFVYGLVLGLGWVQD